MVMKKHFFIFCMSLFMYSAIQPVKKDELVKKSGSMTRENKLRLLLLDPAQKRKLGHRCQCNTDSINLLKKYILNSFDDPADPMNRCD